MDLVFVYMRPSHTTPVACSCAQIIISTVLLCNKVIFRYLAYKDTLLSSNDLFPHSDYYLFDIIGKVCVSFKHNLVWSKFHVVVHPFNTLTPPLQKNLQKVKLQTFIKV